jgi:hypothetical protein
MSLITSKEIGMYVLRTLSIHDVVRALKRRELRLALRISQNLGSNAVSSVRFRLHKRARLSLRHATRRAS